MTAQVEIREPGLERRRLALESGPLEVGRECDGLVVVDPAVSRRHLLLTAGDDGLTVVDLGSTNGTTLNGSPLTAGTAFGLHAGDSIGLAGTTIVVVETGAVVTTAPAPAPAPMLPPAGPAGPAEPAVPATSATAPAVRPALDELASTESDAAVVRYRPGSAGEAAASAMSAAVRRARRRLSGIGSEPWGVKPQICLVDPFPDPDHSGEVVTGGTVVDSARGEIWMVVSAESPPEAPERPLALLFGAALPAAVDLGVVLEGYGLHLSGSPDPDPRLREMELPPFAAAEGELAGAMALSFVNYLLKRADEASLRRLLAESKPGRVDVTATDVYGTSLAGLEEAWSWKLASGPPDVRAGQFLRLALRYLRPHRRREAEMFVYMLLGLAFTMVFPFAVKRLFDTAIPSGELSQVMGVLGFLGAAFAVSLLATLRRSYLAAYVSSAVIRQIRTSMFARMQAQSTGWFSRHQQGDVLSRLVSDVASLEAGLSETVREGFFQVLSLVVASLVLLTLDPLLGAIVLAGAPVVGLVYKAMSGGARKRSIAVQERMGGLVSTATENFSAQGVVKAFALEARERARFGRACDRLFDAQLRLQLFGGLFGLSVNTVVTFLRLAVIGVGAWLILEGNLTIGGLVAFLGLMGEVLSPVTALTGIGQEIQAATGALERVNEVLQAVPEIDDAPDAVALPPLRREIHLEGVGFSYTPERRTLEGIDVVIPAGSRVAFVGPTGAGKSSVLQLLMRFVDPDEGVVRFDGRDIRTGAVASLRGQLGVVFQESFLFDATIRENIAMGKPSATDEEVEAATRAAELHDFIAELPRGYDTLVGERGGRLSGGQRQRLAIARALLRDPSVLILDEATSALDPRTERLIASTLERVGAGRTT
ncbi:MAG: ATP-binding cassette domain-containing protein, partial [Actinobacteria bacterium]|nr:ATP-binding cassette domain-containing protein [Actinomycetota bacterium]